MGRITFQIVILLIRVVVRSCRGIVYDLRLKLLEVISKETFGINLILVRVRIARVLVSEFLINLCLRRDREDIALPIIDDQRCALSLICLIFKYKNEAVLIRLKIDMKLRFS